MQSSGIPNGGHIRQESQEQSEVDHGDFEMVVSLPLQERGGASELPSSSYSVGLCRAAVYPGALTELSLCSLSRWS